MDTAAIKWARHRGAKAIQDAIYRRWVAVSAELEAAARVTRVTLSDARETQRLEDADARAMCG